MSQQINLFNPVLLKQKKLFSAATMAQGLGVILLVLVAVGAYLQHRTAQLRAQSAAVAKDMATVEEQIKHQVEQTKPKEKNKALEAEIAYAQARLQSRTRVLDVVQHSELGNSKGYSAYFRALARQSVDGVWLTGFSVAGAGADINIDGHALRPELVPGYIQVLSREPAFKGKAFAALHMRQTQAAGKDKEPSGPAHIEFTLGTSEHSQATAILAEPAAPGMLPGSAPDGTAGPVVPSVLAPAPITKGAM